MFKVGDWAEWDVKNGTVRAECIAIVPEGYTFGRALNAVGIDPYSFSFGDGAYAARKHGSYLFASPPGPRRGKRKLYWPKVDKLRRVVE